MTGPWTTLIDATELAGAIDRAVVVDCRYELTDHAAGRRAYDDGHIPSAAFLDMETELSGPKTGRNGRHPLPDRTVFRRRLEALGVSDDTQIVAYDAHGGAMASRLWALARWLGHRNVAVLDGDLRAWKAAGFPLTADPSAPRPPGKLSADRPPLLAVVTADALLDPSADAGAAAQAAAPGTAAQGTPLVVDARAPERFSGAVEPIDPVAGHIPGALNRPFGANLRPDGRFKPAAVLRDAFATLLADRPADRVVHQCGSGVTACHNLLAMEQAGLTGSRLYPGSWSEWVADPARPVATGDG